MTFSTKYLLILLIMSSFGELYGSCEAGLLDVGGLVDRTTEFADGVRFLILVCVFVGAWTIGAKIIVVWARLHQKETPLQVAAARSMASTQAIRTPRAQSDYGFQTPTRDFYVYA